MGNCVSDIKVTKRAVFLIRGYDTKSADGVYAQIAREYARFSGNWKVDTSIEPLEITPDGSLAIARMRTCGKDWQVDTDFGVFIWSSLVRKDFSHPFLLRLWRYLVTFADYVFSGTAFAFVRKSWRFSLYFLYPFLLLMLFAVVSAAVGMAVSSIGFPGSLLVGIFAGCGLFYLFFQIPGRRWFVLHLMDLWSFSRNYLRGRRADGEEKVNCFARAVVKAARSGIYDEILLVGHSTGGALILDIAATALAMDPELARQKGRIAIMTIGSTALKIGLHPAANRFREKVQTLVDCQDLDWVEFQSHTDVINFYKTDPVREMRLSSNREDTFPIIRRVRIRDMLEDTMYRKIKRRFFRVHYQFILANTKHYFYDFFMICCGPLLLPYRAKERIAGDGKHEAGQENG